MQGGSAEEIDQAARDNLLTFMQRRARFLLYK
jgi:hypothetical protein